MLYEIFIVVVLCLVPFLELRFALPFAIVVLKLNPAIAFLIAVVVTTLLAPTIYFALTHFLKFVLRFRTIDKLYARVVQNVALKAEPYVQKFGTIGIATLVALPFPATGTYTASLVAFLLATGYKRLFIGNFFGVAISATFWLCVALGINIVALLLGLI